MIEHRTGCVVCGEELVYGESEALECFYCHKMCDSNVKCLDSHFVCDVCHSASANELIESFCSTSTLEDPLEMALILMRNSAVKMHGPEHHFLVPAVLLASYYNIRKDYSEKGLKIKEARKRASSVLGGFCGSHGDCGAAVGTGIFISLITYSTPLSIEGWKLSNLMTSKSLYAIANRGGPRCCKRNTYLAILEAVKFLKENFGVVIKIRQDICCEFNDLNEECLREKCPFYNNDHFR
jgi:hypothetical protein